jgi:hypothetical protein
MNKLILLFLLIPINLFAQVDFQSSISFEYYPQWSYGLLQDQDSGIFLDYNNITSIDLSMDLILYSNLYIGGGIQTWMLPPINIWFEPFYTEYITHIYYTFPNLTLGIEHMCQHPIINNISQDWLLRAGYTKVFAKLHYSTLSQ